MPSYLYQCPACHSITEVIAPMRIVRGVDDNHGEMTFKCERCGAKTRRDYKRENKTMTYHPTKGRAK